ncbi:methyl-accepting chemotaxis protein McpC [Clostridium acetireducens DSM 10703]|jgi:methyl-accepting chemotaxis protein|uniref:Methyl-accepting chemotaxis protein McpC n=1 Tax=Clostridium acetireducens DSM 10703 TaxID=1121290 RepID=A0A1E8EVF6_9CLOT|nr:methyl-accepting chemotaxis protein [Clostridium acetireducens]OFH97966.1 methyl-accepting chemotaxis protein McpC [Clostridium acetireducens DSM 10703]
MRNKFIKNKSIKFKVLTTPLCILFLVISIISLTAISIAKSKLVKQMKIDGINLATQISRQVSKNSQSMKVINNDIELRIHTLATFLAQNSENVNNDYLKQLAKYFQVDEVNVTDEKGKVIYSNLDTAIDAVFGPDHISYSVVKGDKNTLMEDIRKSRETGDYYKYGYVRKPKGGMIQIGILSNQIYKLIQSVSSERIIDELVQDKNIVYASVIGEDLKVIADSNKTNIGKTIKDENLKDIMLSQKDFVDITSYNGKKNNVCRVIVPLYKSGDNIGVVEVGLSMANVYSTMIESITLILIIASISFLITALIFYSISKDITNPLKEIVVVSKKIGNGDLNNTINIDGEDEVGVLAKNFKVMCDNLRQALFSVKSQANKTEDMASSLNANAEEMTSATNEVASSIQSVTKGSYEQSNDLTVVLDKVTILTSEIDNIISRLDKIKYNSNDTMEKANEGKEKINLLLGSIECIKESFENVVSKIVILNESVSKVGNITEVINGISEQTNLLALNAAIEAARAGEAGKGFSVVAEEIRELAEKSRHSTVEIQKLVSSISNETKDVSSNTSQVKGLVEEQIDIVNVSINSFNNILKSIALVVPMIEDTYEALNITNESKEIVFEKVESLSYISQENSASSEEVSASSEELLANSEEVCKFANELNFVAEELKNTLEKFTL